MSGADAPGAPASAASGPEIRFEIEALVRALGLIFYNTMKSCWFSASDRRQTMIDSFSVVTTALQRHDSIRLSFRDGELNVNGAPFELQSESERVFVSQVCELGASNFLLRKGLAQDEFIRLLDLLCKPRTEIERMGGFIEAVSTAGFENVSSHKTILREVAEGEAVVDKKALEAIAADERQKIEGDVLAILRSDTEPGEAQLDSLRKATEDADTMAGLVMRAVQQDLPPADAADRRKTSEMVATCLDRAFDALLKDPFSKTQKGKKAIAKALQHLESELMSRFGSRPEADEMQLLSTTVERMTERLKMDSIVQDYTRKLKALESSEAKILRFMRLQGLDRIGDGEMESKLSEEGIDVSGWHHLLARSAGGADGDEDEVAERAVGKLAELLDQLQRDVGGAAGAGGGGGGTLSEDLKKVSAEVGIHAENTASRIGKFVDEANTDAELIEAMEQAAAREGKRVSMPRRKLLVTLAELVQELCQPLSVISCSIEMVESQSLGAVSPGQSEILRLALESVARMKRLIDNLERISGFPAGLHPDAEIQRQLNA